MIDNTLVKDLAKYLADNEYKFLITGWLIDYVSFDKLEAVLRAYWEEKLQCKFLVTTMRS